MSDVHFDTRVLLPSNLGNSGNNIQYIPFPAKAAANEQTQAIGFREGTGRQASGVHRPAGLRECPVSERSPPLKDFRDASECSV